MKKLSRITALLIVVIMIATALSACVTNGTTILITATKDTLEVGDSIAVAVLATDGGDTTLTVDKNDIVEIVDGNTIRVKAGATITSDTVVTLTATLNSDPKVTATKQFTVKAPSNKPIISINSTKNIIKADESVTFVTVSSDRGSITLSAVGANANLVKFNGDTMIVVGTITMDTDITVVATLDSDPTVTAQKIITIKGPDAGAWIDLVADRYNIDSNHHAILTVRSHLGENVGFTITTDAPENVQYFTTSHMLRVSNDVTTAKTITVTATLVDDPNVKKSITMTIVPPDVVPTIEIVSKGNVVESGKDLELTVKVSTSEDYALSVSDTSLVQIVKKDGKDYISVKEDAQLAFDKIITVTATLSNDNTVREQKTFVVRAPRVGGKVQGKNSVLTSEMFTSLASKSLTAKGVLVDYYEDFNQSRNNSENFYDILVKMEDGKWYGAWNVKGESNINVDTYIRSDETITVNGNSGYIMKRVCINKDNTVAYTNITDYQSVPTMWENQHLWNHFGDDSTNNYTYMEDQSTDDYDIYEFTADKEEWSVALYLTYISFAYTPLLDDTLDRLYLKVNSDNEIIGLIGYTEYLYYGNDTREDADAMSYTKIEVDFENVGTTTVPTPAVYDAPQHADKLQAALTNMANATNYTFKAIDTTTHAPSGDDSDYTTESVSSGNAIQTMSISGNYTSSTSPLQNNAVGLQGWITNDAILLESTTKYSYTMDGKDFRVEYSGYKAKTIDSKNYYDHFIYKSAFGGYFEGDRQYLGSITNVLPKWNFSPNVFEFVRTGTSGGVTTYEFRLRDSAITRDVAMQVSMYSYARDGASSATVRMSIVVDDNGNVLSTRYPYSVTQGTYLGYVTTTYSNIGSTTIDAQEFEGYEPREVNKPWSSYELKYYHPDHSTQSPYAPGTGETILKIMFGDDWTSFPPMSVFTDAFGDSVSGPFFEWRDITNASGEVIGYEDYFAMTADTDDYDENMHISYETYDRIISALSAGLAEYGFEDGPRTPKQDPSDRTNRYVFFVNEELGCQIRIMNNHTKNFFIDVGKLGFWTLS